MTTSVLEEQFLAGCLNGNREAMAFVRALFDAFHFWDDLIDRDKPLSDGEIDRNLFAMLVELPSNAFFAANRGVLIPVMLTAIHNWKAANAIETRDDAAEDERMVAFVIRSSYVDVLVMCAQLVGGYAWAQEWTRRIRAVVHDEGFSGYQAALAAEKEARDVVLRG